MKTKSDVLSGLSEFKTLTNSPEFPIEYLRAFIASENAQYTALGLPNFVCPVIEQVDLAVFLERFPQNIDATERFQCIIKNKAHYFTIGMIWGPTLESRQVILLDAAGDLKGYQTAFFLEKTNLFSKVFVVSGSRKTGLASHKTYNLQNDTDHCPLFAFDHAVQLSRIDLFSHCMHLLQAQAITQQENSSFISLSWEKLPIPFVQHAQTLKLLEKHAQENQRDLKADYPIFLDVNKEKGKFINCSIARLFEEKRHQTLIWLKTASEADFQQTLVNPIETATFNWKGSYKQVGLFARDTDQSSSHASNTASPKL
jgi:hypothetical protein